MYATTNYGFETTDLSENEVNQIWQNINLRKSPDLKSLDNIELPIVSFDVSKDGIILLGFKENKIAISNSNNVLTLFEFDNDGSFYVQWNDGNILLMLVRGSIVIEFSQDGQLINMVKTDDSSVKNNSLWNQIAKRKSVNIGQASYYVKNDMGMFNFLASSYSQLITEDSQGNQTILYDVNNTQMTKTIVAFFAVIVFAAVVVLMIISFVSASQLLPRYGYSVVKATAKRNNEYSKLLYHCDNVSNHWELIEGSLANDEILAAQNIPDLLII